MKACEAHEPTPAPDCPDCDLYVDPYNSPPGQRTEAILARLRVAIDLVEHEEVGLAYSLVYDVLKRLDAHKFMSILEVRAGRKSEEA